MLRQGLTKMDRIIALTKEQAAREIQTNDWKLRYCGAGEGYRTPTPEAMMALVSRYKPLFISQFGKWCPEEDSNLHALASAST
jgi:Fe-S oxidoreductase